MSAAGGRQDDDGVGPLVTRARAGDPRSVGRLLTLVEDPVGRRAVLAGLAQADGPDPGRTAVVGLTGPPGVGKSTTTSALVAAYRDRGLRVAVLAVDPSSPFSGGALLGDRIRMQSHATDAGVFIRSVSSRGRLGGLAASTPQAVRVLAGVGVDVVLIETVGVGQSEVEVAGLADTTVVLLAPGMGDGVQAAKAGLLEVGDVYVVNKADRDGADATVRDLRQMLAIGPERPPGVWRPPVLTTVASTGTGVPELLAAMGAHREHEDRVGGLDARRLRRARLEVASLALARTADRLEAAGMDEAGTALTLEVAAGRLDPDTAADRLLARLPRP